MEKYGSLLNRRRTLEGLTGLGLAGGFAFSAQGLPLPLNDRITGDIAAHDPVIIKQAGTYYVFYTGRNIPMHSSTDLVTWKNAGTVFEKNPDWIAKEVPTARDIWAPDISFHDGQYWLYYAVSTFGTNQSAIGLATNKTLDRAAPDFKWEDQGMVIKSEAAPPDQPGSFNCIDPNFVIDAGGKHWLAFGSFWSGIKIAELNPKTGKLAAGYTLHDICSRPSPDGGNFNRVEGVFIVRHGNYYYQFVSYDSCCKGVNSSYYTVVGRSRNILGPYLDRKGRSLMDGFGDVVLMADLAGKDRWRGPGHCGILQNDDGADYIVYHSYDKNDNGRSKLRIAPLVWWPDGWVTAVT
jgi:arabinan endo-1,5-alpha-L-arabinosidase